MWSFTARTFLFSLLMSGAATVVSAQDDSAPLVTGQEEFSWNCASCHGEDARGNGALAKALIKPPSDLTVLAKNNGGVFPFDRVVKTIAGKELVSGHETFQMPKYWQRFRAMEGQRGFESADKRIDAIARYLETIQVR